MNGRTALPRWALRIACMCLGLMCSCASVAHLPSPPPAEDRAALARLLTMFDEQDRAVRSFYGTGRGVLTRGDTETDLLVSTAGTRTPLRLILELTHPWGRPILHILVADDTVQILSHGEKRVYRFPSEASGRFGPLPASLDAHLLWSVARGFPAIRPEPGSAALGGTVLTWRDAVTRDEALMECSAHRDTPERLALPGRHLEVLFSDFAAEAGIRYARSVTVNAPQQHTVMEITRTRMVLNEPIPDPVFQLTVPSGFTTHTREERNER